MRFDIVIAASAGIVAKSDAFVSPHIRSSRRSRPSISAPPLNVGGPYGNSGGPGSADWDNDDFLANLSNGPQPADVENEGTSNDDHLFGGKSNVPDADGSKLKTDHDNDGPGGSRFKEMMEKAKEGKRVTPQSQQQQQPAASPPPLQYTPPPEYTQAQQAAAAAPPAPQIPGLPEDQAALFQQFMAFQQMQQQAAAAAQQGGAVQQQQQQPSDNTQAALFASPPPAPVMDGLDAKGRKIGRNKDADSISNSADLYFAQLKRDSTVRTIARYSGDDDTANKVMEHESVKELDDTILVNPFLKAEQEAEEQLQYEEFLQMYGDDIEQKKEKVTKAERAADDTGVSYRDKLKAAREKRNKGGGQQSVQQPSSPSAAEAAVEVVTVPEPTVFSPPPPPPPPVVVEAAPAPAPAPAVQKTASAAAAAEKVVQTENVVVPPTTDVPKEEQDQKSAENAVWVSDKAVAPVPAPSTKDDEDTRRDIRTLMGLILKHRGGPGFGKGRLAAPEAKRFETLLGKVTALLRSEAGMAVSAGGGASAAAPIAEVQQPTAAATTPTKPAAASSSSMSGGDRLSGTLACIEGALQMYKSSPSESKEENLMSLKAALDAASKMISSEKEVASTKTGSNNNDAPMGVQQQPAAAAAAATSTMGFPDSYKVTKPDEAADAAAATTTTTMDFPDSYEVTKPNDDTANTPSSQINSEEGNANTKVLKRVYDKLVDASGDGKFGLKGEMTAEEADTLADELVEMRGILMKELDSGI